MFVLELQVLPVLQRSLEGSGAPMDFADGGQVQFQATPIVLVQITLQCDHLFPSFFPHLVH